MIVDYEDKDGIKRRVLVPDNSHAKPEEGIPLSLDVDELYRDCPYEFRRRLVEELWNVGLIEASDFLASDATIRIRAALLAAIRYDTMDILNYAKGLVKNGIKQ